MKYLKKFNESLSQGELDAIRDRTLKILPLTWPGTLSVNPDGTVDLVGGVSIRIPTLNKIDFKFGRIDGSFSLSGTSIKNLEGFPNYVGGDCAITDSEKLTSLEGGPEFVEAGFYIHGCSALTSLEGGPKYVGSIYHCGTTPRLTSLVGAPETISGMFHCPESAITDLVGLPQRLDGSLHILRNLELTSLEGIPKFVNGNIDARGCWNLWDPTPLKDCNYTGQLRIHNTPLESLLFVFGGDGNQFKESLDYNYIRGPIISNVTGKYHGTINLFRFKEALDEFDIDYMSLSDNPYWVIGPNVTSMVTCQWLFVDDEGRRVNFQGGDPEIIKWK